MNETITTNQAQAIKAVYALHDAGHAATLHSHDGRWIALDLDAPVVDVVDALDELGLDANDAEDVAHRLVARGY